MSLENLPKKPNIVLIITDQEREVMHWPEGWAEENLKARNRLLKNGLMFRNAQCNTATCTPSRATLMTGLYPAQHGLKTLLFFDNPDSKWQRSRPQLSPDLPNIATVLAEAGYHVVLKGKFHLMRPVRYDGERKRHYWSEADKEVIAERYGFHGWNPPDMGDPIGMSDYGGGSTNNDGRFVDGTGTAAGQPMDEDEQFQQSAVHFLNNYDGGKPFCLIVGLVNPHDVQAYPGRGVNNPVGPPSYEKGGYKLEDFENLPIGLPPTVDEDLSTKPSIQASFRRFVGIGAGNVNTRKKQTLYARFYAYLCSEVDKQVGKVLDALDANGLTEDTLIVRTSDHGELGMAHGNSREKFYNAYRETLSVPLIFSNPKLFPEPQATDAFAGLIDILPTLASIVDVPDRERFQFRGQDLTPILNDAAEEVQDYHHFTYEDDQFGVAGANCIRALVEKDWKYAVYYDPFKGQPVEYEMYDLKNDPHESINLAHPDNSQPASIIAQRRRLHNRLIEVMEINGTTPHEVLFPTAEMFEQGYATPQDVYHDPIDPSLRRRQRIYTVIGVLTALGALNQLFFHGALWLGTAVALGLGVLAGLYFFSRMTPLSWDDEQGRIVSKMDRTSIAILIGYIGVVLLGDAPILSRFLESGTISAATASFVTGIMIGQIRALRRKIKEFLDPEKAAQRTYSAQIEIDAPAEEVWQVVTDFASYKTWNPLLSDVQGDLVVGGDLKVQTTFAPMALNATVLAAEKPKIFEWEDHVPLKLLTPVFSVRLLPLTENRTRTLIQESFSGPLLPILGGRLDKQMPPLYEAMAQALEQQVKLRLTTTSK